MEQKNLIEEIIKLVDDTPCAKSVLTTYDQDLMQSVKESIIEAIKRKYQDGQ